MDRVATIKAHLDLPKKKLFHPPQGQLLAEYDFIVIGAGSAGAPLAAEIAKKLPNKTVLICDSGGSNQHFKVRSPFLTCPDLQNSELDFAYRTTPQPLQQNRRSHWPRGKCLGGSSSINFMLAVRGDARGYDKWETEWGCEGWNWQEVESWFNYVEDYQSSNRVLPKRGKRGAMHVRDLRDVNFHTKGTCEAFVRGCSEFGCPEVDDYNAPQHRQKAGLSQANVNDSGRHDTATAFLFERAFKTCPNLSCLTNEHCHRVLFDDDVVNKRAVAVEFASGLKIQARCEILLSAGAVGSPHILLLSGVGPKSHLEEKQVRCVVDLPGVGRNLKDHLMVGQSYSLKDPSHTLVAQNVVSHLLPNLARYFLLGDGIFTIPWVQAMAFMDSTVQKKTDANDIQIHFVPFQGPRDDEKAKEQFGFDREVHQLASKESGLPFSIMFLPSLLQPRSAGYIELNSNNPLDHPVIEPNYLSHPDDIKVLMEAWRFCEKVAMSKAMSHIVDKPFYDDSVKYPLGSDEYVRTKVTRDVITIYHPTSTCRMGADHDVNAVLDTHCRVRKVKGLRVVDCSSFPDIPAANTNFPAIMLGVRIADFIYREYKNQ